MQNKLREEDRIWYEILEKTKNKYPIDYQPCVGVTIVRSTAEKLLREAAIRQAHEDKDGNGIFLVYDGKHWAWAIHNMVVETDMFDTYFNSTGVECEEFMFFYNDVFALATYNLYVNVPEAVEKYLVSIEALVIYLNQKCKARMEEFNSCVQSFASALENKSKKNVLLKEYAKVNHIPRVELPDAQTQYFLFPLLEVNPA